MTDYKNKLRLALSVVLVAAFLMTSALVLAIGVQASPSGTTLTSNEGLGAGTVPDAPRNLIVDQGPGFNWLWWDHPATQGSDLIKYYEIWRGTTSGGEAKIDTILVGNTTFNGAWMGGLNVYNDTSVVLDTTYWYKIKAVSDAGASDFSNEASATPSLTGDVPDSPTLIGTNAIYSAQLSWNWPSTAAGSPPARFFFLYRDPGIIFGTLIDEWMRVTTYTDEAGFFTALGQPYDYSVTAVNTYGESSPGTSTVTIEGTGLLPSAPRNLTGFGYNQSVWLVWDEPADPSQIGFINYDVFRSDTETGNYSKIGESTVFFGYAGFYTDNGLTNNQTYWYEVRANNSNGQGPFSNVTNATPQQTNIPSFEVSYLNAYPGNNQVLLEWGYAYNATGYEIWRSESTGTEELLTNVTSSTHYFDTTALNGHTYYYIVKPKHDLITGTQSPEASASPSTGPAPSPPILAVTPGDSGVVLYSPPSDTILTSPIIGWEIYRGSVSGGENLTPIDNVTDISFDTEMWWTDTTAMPDVNYFYTVKALGMYGLSDVSNEASSFMSPTGDVPDPVTTISATGQAGSILVSWNSPTYEGTAILLHYDIERNDSANDWQTVHYGFVDVAGTSGFTDHSVIPGVTYTYRVQVWNEYGDANVSTAIASASATQGTSAPSAPQNLAAVAGLGYVNLTWLAPTSSGSSAIIRYDIYRGTSAGSIGTTPIGNVAAGTLTYNDTSVTNGQTYHYQVKAVNSVGSSVASNTAQATPSTTGTAPGIPTGLAAVGHVGYIYLTWTAPSNAGSGVSNYLVFRATMSGGQGATPLATVTGVNYTDTSATPGVPYFYKVKANNSIGASAFSDEATGTATSQTAGTPSAPQNLVAAPGQGKVTLTWQAPASDGGNAITGYKVYRALAGTSQLLANVSASTLSYIDTNGTVGTTYSYSVLATNANGSGAETTPVNAASQASGGGGTDNTMLYVGVGAVAVIAVVGGAAALIMRRRK